MENEKIESPGIVALSRIAGALVGTAVAAGKRVAFWAGSMKGAGRGLAVQIEKEIVQVAAKEKKRETREQEGEGEEAKKEKTETKGISAPARKRAVSEARKRAVSK